MVTHVPYTLLYFHRGGSNNESQLERLREAYANFEMHFESVDVEKADASLIKCLDLVGMPPLPAYAIFHENIMAKTLRGDTPEDNILCQVNEQLARDPRNYRLFNNRSFEITRWYHQNSELMRILPEEHQEAIAPAVLEEGYAYDRPLGVGSWDDPTHERYYGKGPGGEVGYRGSTGKGMQGAIPGTPGATGGMGGGVFDEMGGGFRCPPNCG